MEWIKGIESAPRNGQVIYVFGKFSGFHTVYHSSHKGGWVVCFYNEAAYTSPYQDNDGENYAIVDEEDISHWAYTLLPD